MNETAQVLKHLTPLLDPPPCMEVSEVSKKYISKTCSNCKEEYKTRDEKSLYCSRQCFHLSRKGTRNPKRLGLFETSEGYLLRYSPNHPNAQSNGYVLDHRLVVESSIGRLLLNTEIVHHINGDPSDNSIDNLSVMSQSKHARLHQLRLSASHARKRGRWALEHDSCSACGASDRPHYGCGLCGPCYYRKRRRELCLR